MTSREVRVLIGAMMSMCALDTASAGELCVMGWNIESGGSRQEALESLFEPLSDCDVFGFAEVASPNVLEGLSEAAKDNGISVDWIISNTSKTGPENAADFLALMWNSKTVDLIRYEELYEKRLGRGRAPFIGYFREEESNKEFSVMVNHFHRGSKEKRLKQSIYVRDFAKRNNDEALILIGDYNFDWTIRPESDGYHKRDPAFDAFLEGGIIVWVKPDPITPTTCYERSPGILDFVFVSGAAKNWKASSKVLISDSLCPDNRHTPDHRPVEARFVTGND